MNNCRTSRSRLPRCGYNKWACAVVCIGALVSGTARGAEAEQTDKRDASSATAPASDAKSDPEYTTRRIRGRVVWMAEALARRYQIKSVPEAGERLLALESSDGKLYPIVADIRGRSFRRDERLRTGRFELLVRQYEGSPMVQVIRIFALRDGKRYELDYWCEICAIAMYELKECDCCQGPIELRQRLVEEPEEPSATK